MPYEIPELAGKPYRPSNGTEGLMFQEDFCDRCALFDTSETAEGRERGCEIQDRTYRHDPGEKEYPEEWVHDWQGRPTCTAFLSGTGPRNGSGNHGRKGDDMTDKPEGITAIPEQAQVELNKLDEWKTEQLAAADTAHKQTRAKIHEHYRTERKRLVKLLDWLKYKDNRPDAKPKPERPVGLKPEPGERPEE